MSLTWDITGSCETSAKNAARWWKPPSRRARDVARSNRNPSTCICSTQYLQRVHDHSQAGVVVDVQRVAGAGRVQVARRVVRVEPVVAGVVQTAMAQGRPAVVTLARVVEDDVEQHLQPRSVQGSHHVLELGHLPTGESAPHRCRVRRRAGRRNRSCRTPSSSSAPAPRGPAGGRTAAPGAARRPSPPGSPGGRRQRGWRQPGVGSAQVRRDVGMGLGEPPHVQLVDDAVAVRDARLRRRPPSRRPGRRRASGASRRRSRACFGRGGPRAGTPAGCRPSGAHRPWPSRTGRAAAWPGCSADRAAARRGRSPGSRTAGRRQPPGRTRARPRRRHRESSPGARRHRHRHRHRRRRCRGRCRRGRARPGWPVGSTRRSSCRPPRASRRAGRVGRATRSRPAAGAHGDNVHTVTSTGSSVGGRPPAACLQVYPLPVQTVQGPWPAPSGRPRESTDCVVGLDPA